MKQKVGDVITFSYGAKVKFEFKIKDMVMCKEELDDSDGHWAWTYALQLLEDAKHPQAERQIRLAYWVATPGSGKRDRFGQYAPTLNEQTLLKLMRQAIRKGFFSDSFVEDLGAELKG